MSFLPDRADRLFVTWNCSDCTAIKIRTNSAYFFEDKAKGGHGQHLVVIQSYSNSGARQILNDYGYGEDVFMPILKTFDDRTLDKVEDILAYMKVQGYLIEGDLI